MSETRFEFWRKALFVATIGFLLFGMVLAWASSSVVFELWNSLADDVFFDGQIPAQAAEYRSFILGPLGGTIAGFYLLQAFVVAIPFKRRERWAWHACLWPMLLWFMVDSPVSIAHGALYNVLMVNLTPLVLCGIPLAMTWPAFKKNASSSTTTSTVPDLK